MAEKIESRKLRVHKLVKVKKTYIVSDFGEGTA